MRIPRLPSLSALRAFRPTRRLLIGVAAAILVPSAWLLARGPAAPDNSLVARVKRGPFAVTVNTSGELRARQFVQITAPAGAQQAGAWQMKIQSIVPEGTVVKQGDVVAELDRSTLASKLAEVQLALTKAQAQYEQAMLDSTLTLSTARENIRTMELALEEKRLAKEEAVYEAPTVRRQAEIDYERAERALAQARTDYVTKTEQARAKMREVGADLQRQRNFLGVVQDVMAGVTIRAPPPGDVMYVDECKRVETREVASGLYVPLEAVRSEGVVPFVYRVSGGRISKQEVVTGAMNDDEVIIVRGLEEGDRVLLTPPPGHDRLTLVRLPAAARPAPVAGRYPTLPSRAAPPQRDRT